VFAVHGHGHIGDGVLRLGGHLGQAEIQDFCVAALGDEDIRGLDIPVNDAFRVRRIERVGHINGDFHQPLE